MAATEQRPQQDQLGVAGVLVLIEQHHLITAAFGRADLGMAGRDPRGDGHLVAVVDDLTLGLGPCVPGHHGQQLLPGPLAVQDLAHRAGQFPGQRRGLGLQPVPHPGHLVRRPQVLSQLARQHQHGRGHRGR